MESNGPLLALLLVFAVSCLLGAASTYLLVRTAGKPVLWTFAVPFTLWWLVAGLSVYLLHVRTASPPTDLQAPAPAGPLTPRSPLDVDTL